MRDAVVLTEGEPPRVSGPRYEENARWYLVSRMYTDAIFNDDIHMIQQIVNRIDGGVVPEELQSGIQTKFGDCLEQVLAMDEASRLKVTPDDTVLMALCKALYDKAAHSIYWDRKKKRPRKPASWEKAERDAAIKMIFERTQGRKSQRKLEERGVEAVASEWLGQLLPESSPDQTKQVEQELDSDQETVLQ